MEIDGRKVVASGSFVIGHGQSLTFCPFPHDQTFRLAVDMQLERHDEPANISVGRHATPSCASIKVAGGYHDGIHVANDDPIRFASDVDKTYYGNFSVACKGDFEKFTSVFSYTILETERS